MLKLSASRRNEIQNLIDDLYHFDYYTAYSDDHRVYSNGVVAERNLSEKIKNTKLTNEEKDLILRVLGYRFDATYNESIEFYNCIAKDYLWSDKENTNSLKKIIMRFLDC